MFHTTGTMSVEAVYQDRDKFAALVREVATPDLGRMGMEILSFTIKDVNDTVQYLDSLGKAQTAAVKRDADIGVAEAGRDAGIKVSFSFVHEYTIEYSRKARKSKKINGSFWMGDRKK